MLIKVIREIVFANVQSTPTPDLSWLPCCHMTWWNLPSPQLQPFSISDPSFPSIPRTHLYHYGHQHLRLCHHRRGAFLFLTPPQTSITPSLLTSSNGRLLYFERSVTAFDCLVASKIVVDWRIVGFIVKSVDLLELWGNYAILVAVLCWCIGLGCLLQLWIAGDLCTSGCIEELDIQCQVLIFSSEYKVTEV